jgi:Tfp pilus assembly protein PilN
MSLAFTKLALGIDCGEGAITLTALGRRLRRFTVIDQLRLTHPLGEDAGVQVAAFLDRHRLREARAIACLPRDAVLVRFLDLPVEAEPQLAKVIGYQLSALHPFKDEQVYWDCKVVEHEPKAKQISAMVVLAESSRVNLYRQMLQELGLRLSGLTLGAAAVARLAKPLLPPTTLIVNGRSSDAELLSFRQGNLCATQSIAVEPSASARERFEREWHRALAALPISDPATLPWFVCGSVPAPFSDLLQGASPLPAPKLNLTFHPVSPVLGARPDPAIAAEGSARARLEGDATSSHGSAGFDWPSLAAAYLGLLRDTSSFINLLPSPERWLPQRTVPLPAYGLGATAMLLALTLAAHGWIERALYGRALDRQMLRLAVPAQRVKQQEQATGALENRAAVLGALQASNWQKLRLLEELTKLLPDGTWLEELHMDEDTVEINGFSDRAADLVPPLENSRYFTQVEFAAPITRDVKSKEVFRIRMRLKH